MHCFNHFIDFLHFLVFCVTAEHTTLIKFQAALSSLRLKTLIKCTNTANKVYDLFSECIWTDFADQRKILILKSFKKVKILIMMNMYNL